jgi:CRP/FNR family transcriptional regulator, cyclic AMP receptor protein
MALPGATPLDFCSMDTDSLRALSFLRDLTDEELNQFAALVTERECKPGERIMEEGVAPTAFYIIADGVVHVRRRTNTREVLLARLGAGSFFGEINLFDPGLATASIYTMKAARLGVVAYDRVRAYMDEHPRAGCKIACGLMREMSQRLRATSARLVNCVFWSDKAGL